MTVEILVVLAGAFVGGFVSGLAGFGTGLTALGIWLHAIAPIPASSLVVICSVISQAQTIPMIWRAVDLRRLWPMLVAGALGVPIGVSLLDRVDPGHFKLSVGVLLIVFSTTLLFGRSTRSLEWGGRAADTAVGLGGGVLGGLAGLSGPLPTMWATLRGWDKDRRRAVFQAYNLSVLTVALAAHGATGLLTREVGWLTLVALPGTLAGAWLGAATYRRMSDHHFDRVVLALLGLSGLALIGPQLGAG